jgi:hypothetical protein
MFSFAGGAAVYSENHPKAINTVCEEHAELPVVKPGGRYNYHWALNV